VVSSDVSIANGDTDVWRYTTYQFAKRYLYAYILVRNTTGHVDRLGLRKTSKHTTWNMAVTPLHQSIDMYGVLIC